MGDVFEPISIENELPRKELPSADPIVMTHFPFIHDDPKLPKALLKEKEVQLLGNINWTNKTKVVQSVNFTTPPRILMREKNGDVVAHYDTNSRTMSRTLFSFITEPPRAATFEDGDGEKAQRVEEQGVAWSCINETPGHGNQRRTAICSFDVECCPICLKHRYISKCIAHDFSLPPKTREIYDWNSELTINSKKSTGVKRKGVTTESKDSKKSKNSSPTKGINAHNTVPDLTSEGDGTIESAEVVDLTGEAGVNRDNREEGKPTDPVDKLEMAEKLAIEFCERNGAKGFLDNQIELIRSYTDEQQILMYKHCYRMYKFCETRTILFDPSIPQPTNYWNAVMEADSVMGPDVENSWDLTSHEAKWLEEFYIPNFPE